MGPIVMEWRRSWSAKPPDMDETHPHWPLIVHDRRYKDVQADIPKGESLEMCSIRVKRFWDAEIVPVVASGKRVVIVAHANSLRSLIKKIDDISDTDIEQIKIPNGIPFTYHFDEKMRVVGTPDESGFRGQFLGMPNAGHVSHYERQARRWVEAFDLGPPATEAAPGKPQVDARV
jgi:2,3-bisphosphoglycerate-dependent phosphoglycerate mutase